jgi:integrase
MTKDVRLWIVKKRKNYTVLKLDNEGKRTQIEKFSTRSDAENYVRKYRVAAALEKVVDVEYNFKEQFEIFANEKAEGGLNLQACLTISGGAVYSNHFRNIIKPYFPDVMLHEVTGATMQKFIDAYLGQGDDYKPELYKTAKRCLANIRRFLNWCISREYQKSFQSAMLYKIPKHLIPIDNKLALKVKATVINPKDAARLLKFVWDHREDSIHAAYACMIFHILFYFGFRRSEILGLRKTDINLKENYFFPQGMFDAESWTYRNKTKNEGAKRKVYFDPNGEAAEKLNWILEYSNKTFPSSDYLVAATRGKNPLSPFMFRKVVYATYEILGLAKVKWSKDNNSKKFTIISCPFKGCISKTWRHLKAAQLIQDQHILKLSDNYIKRVMGHDLISTTRDIYGDHDLLDTTEHLDIAAKIEQHRNPIKLLN